eukprot:Clim_evm79s156 gene=Clim_evmTU79s156
MDGKDNAWQSLLADVAQQSSPSTLQTAGRKVALIGPASESALEHWLRDVAAAGSSTQRGSSTALGVKHTVFKYRTPGVHSRSTSAVQFPVVCWSISRKNDIAEVLGAAIKEGGVDIGDLNIGICLDYSRPWSLVSDLNDCLDRLGSLMLEQATAEGQVRHMKDTVCKAFAAYRDAAAFSSASASETAPRAKDEVVTNSTNSAAVSTEVIEAVRTELSSCLGLPVMVLCVNVPAMDDEEDDQTTTGGDDQSNRVPTKRLNDDQTDYVVRTCRSLCLKSGLGFGMITRRAVREGHLWEHLCAMAGSVPVSQDEESIMAIASDVYNSVIPFGWDSESKITQQFADMRIKPAEMTFGEVVKMPASLADAEEQGHVQSTYVTIGSEQSFLEGLSKVLTTTKAAKPRDEVTEPEAAVEGPGAAAATADSPVKPMSNSSEKVPSPAKPAASPAQSSGATDDKALESFFTGLLKQSKGRKK